MGFIDYSFIFSFKKLHTKLQTSEITEQGENIIVYFVIQGRAKSLQVAFLFVGMLRNEYLN
jgi:hypothetical protein